MQQGASAKPRHYLKAFSCPDAFISQYLSFQEWKLLRGWCQEYSVLRKWSREYVVPRPHRYVNSRKSAALRHTLRLIEVRWAGDVMRLNGKRWAVGIWIPLDVKQTSVRPPTRWTDFFAKFINERHNVLCVLRASRIHWTTPSRERDNWKCHRRLLVIPEEQQKSRWSSWYPVGRPPT